MGRGVSSYVFWRVTCECPPLASLYFPSSYRKWVYLSVSFYVSLRSGSLFRCLILVFSRTLSPRQKFCRRSFDGDPVGTVVRPELTGKVTRRRVHDSVTTVSQPPSDSSTLISTLSGTQSQFLHLTPNTFPPLPREVF